MKQFLPDIRPGLALLAILISASLPSEADAARGRPYINEAGTTFVADNGSLLRGAQMATDSGGTGYPTATITAIKNFGCNAVHLYAERADQGYAAGAKASLVDSIVQTTRDNGLYLIITIGGGGVNQTFATNFWNFYAGRYANETHVLYEIQNEATWGGPSSAALIAMQQNCYTLIRSQAPNTPILFFSYVAFNNGPAIVQDITNLGPGIDWNNAAVAFHGYGEGGRNGCRTCLIHVLNAGYPCFQTEFYLWPWGRGNFNLGDGASMYQDVSEMGDFERLGVSWLSFLTLPLVANDARFKTRIQNAGILWDPDYGTWPAGSRSVNGNGGEPWTSSLSSTLRIEAENFDNGGQGISYNDLTTTNSGGQYRTAEGVDIQSTTDTGGGYNVGWISNGEWLEYTTYINDAGRYNLKLRVASPNATNSVKAFFEGVDKTGTWTFAGTGANQTWQTITTTVDLTPGQQIVRINALSSGFNLNWIELTPVSSGTVSNGTFKIVSRNGGKALDVVDASTANGARIQQWGYSGTSNQKWVLTHRAANQYTITCLQTGKGIDEISRTALSGNYIDVWSLWNGIGSSNQRWIITPTDSGYYKIACAHSGLVLEVAGASTANGARIHQGEYTGGTHQQWMIAAP